MVYVDNVKYYNKKDLKYNKCCHLFADTLQELHQFAKQLGLKIELFQNRINLPHYDITQNKRKLAIKYGAQPLNKWGVYKLFKFNQLIK